MMQWIKRLLRRAAPTSLANPARWLYDYVSGGETDAGVPITRDSALGVATVFRCTTLIASTVAKLPLYVYRREGDGKVRDPRHGAYALLRWKANAEMTAFTVKSTLTAHAVLHGNGYAYIVRDEAGRPTALIPLDPLDTTPERLADGPLAGELVYRTRVDGREFTLAAANVLHVKGLAFDGLRGYGVLTVARQSLGWALASRKYLSKFYANSARPSVVIETKDKLNDEGVKQARQAIETLHAGVDKAHRVAVLTHGMTLKPFSLSPEDAQMVESLDFSTREIATFFGVPPHKVGDPTRTAYASLEQENQSFLDDCLDPWLVTWEEETRDKLLTEREKIEDTHTIEFLRQALVRADLQARGTFYTQALTSGWMSRDEVRARENLNPMPDGQGQTFLVPLNMGSANGA